MPIINTVRGDLITLAQEGRYTEIAHGCNCFKVMGAGIAPQIAKAFPKAQIADNKTSYGERSKLGTYSLGTANLDNGRIIAVLNMYTQFGTGGRYKGSPDLDYRAVLDSFTKFNRYISKIKVKFPQMFANQLMGIPMIGAGLAGGDWEVIKTLINAATPDIKIELVEFW